MTEAAFTALDHVQLAMPAGQEEQARRFYRDLLGMTEIAKPAELASRGGCWLESGGVRLHLGLKRIFAPRGKRILPCAVSIMRD